MAEPSTILFIAGDASGDLNTARLADEVLKHHPDWTFHVVGGPHMGAVAQRSPGGVWLGDTSDLAGMGIYASVSMYPRAKFISWRLKRFMRVHKIDATVLCDWGAFNCRHLEFFRKAGVPMLYYFPPGSWRRKGGGGLKFGKLVDRVATPFEWSAQRLSAAGANAEWVGHPLLEHKYDDAKRAALRVEFGIKTDEQLIALLPGSRMTEIECLAPRLARAAEILGMCGGRRFIVAAQERRVEAMRKHFPVDVRIVADRAGDVLAASDAAVVKSGTATLETAVIGTPQAVVYDVPWVGKIEWVLLWMWKKNIPFIAMPNVILERMAVEELLGFDCTPEKIAQAVEGLLGDESKRAALAEAYTEIRRKLGDALPVSATTRTAQMLDEMIEEKQARRR